MTDLNFFIVNLIFLFFLIWSRTTTGTTTTRWESKLTEQIMINDQLEQIGKKGEPEEDSYQKLKLFKLVMFAVW